MTVPLPQKTDEENALGLRELQAKLTQKPEATSPQPGESVEAPYPFVRETYLEHDGVGAVEVPSWRPGTRYESVGGPDSGYTECYADGMGRMELTVVSVHRPGSFPTRVFFLRSWIDPDGKRFGKRKLRITTVPAFRALTRGYRHSFEMAPQVQEATSPVSSVQQTGATK